jgi:arsenate reductase-like glutaredoxin family protein
MPIKKTDENLLIKPDFSLLEGVDFSTKKNNSPKTPPGFNRRRIKKRKSGKGSSIGKIFTPKNSEGCKLGIYILSTIPFSKHIECIDFKNETYTEEEILNKMLPSLMKIKNLIATEEESTKHLNYAGQSDHPSTRLLQHIDNIASESLRKVYKTFRLACQKADQPEKAAFYMSVIAKNLSKENKDLAEKITIVFLNLKENGLNSTAGNGCLKTQTLVKICFFQNKKSDFSNSIPLKRNPTTPIKIPITKTIQKNPEKITQTPVLEK